MPDQPTLLVAHTISPGRADGLLDRLEASLPEGALVRAETPAETFEHAPEATGLITAGIPDGLLEEAPALEWIQTLSAGVDRYDHDAIAERGIALCNSAGVHAEPIAQQVLGYMLTFERDLHGYWRNQERGVWERSGGADELTGKTFGVIGLGGIGTRSAELATAVGMTAIGTKRDLSEVPEVVETCYGADEYREVCLAADYLLLSCPLTDETEGLIGYDELRLLGDEGVLINVARGDVVVEEELVRALQWGMIAGAALDVTSTEPLPGDSPLWDLSNVLLTPHMAGTSSRKDDRWFEIVAANYEAIADSDRTRLRNRVV